MGCGGFFSSGVTDSVVSNPGSGQGNTSNIIVGSGPNQNDYNKTTFQIGQRTRNNNIEILKPVNEVDQNEICFKILQDNNPEEIINNNQNLNIGSKNTNANEGMVNVGIEQQNTNNQVTRNPMQQSYVREFIRNQKISPKKRAQTLQKNNKTENNLLQPRNRSTQKPQVNPQQNANDKNQMTNYRNIQENKKKNKIDRENRAQNEASEIRLKLKQTSSKILDGNQDNRQADKQQIPVPFNQSTIHINLKSTYPVQNLNQSPIKIKVEDSINQNLTHKIKKTNSVILSQENEEVEDKDKGKLDGKQKNDEGKGEGVVNDKHVVLMSTMMRSNDSMMMQSLSLNSVVQSKVALKFN